MSRRSILVLGVAVLAGLAVLGAVLAQTSTNFDLSWKVASGGGGASSSASYELGATAGQPATGETQSTSYRLGAGFWYGVRGATVCPGDLDCDSIVDGSDNCPNVSNSGQEDGDTDDVGDVCDNCPSWPNTDQSLPPWTVPPNDPDCDGWTTADENLIGTNPNLACSGDNWPPDIAPVVRDDFVDISDINMLRPPVFFSTLLGGPPYDTRLDIARDGGNIIDISDINKLRPPIFFATCTP